MGGLKEMTLNHVQWRDLILLVLNLRILLTLLVFYNRISLIHLITNTAKSQSIQLILQENNTS
jgi:hypothetical protein